MDFLISDLLLIIFDYCQLSDLISLKRVNKEYLKLISENYQSCLFKYQLINEQLFIFYLGVRYLIIPDFQQSGYIYDEIYDFYSDFNDRKQNISFSFHLFSNKSRLILSREARFSFSIKKDNFRIRSDSNNFRIQDISFPIKKNDLEFLRLIKLILDESYYYISCDSD